MTEDKMVGWHHRLNGHGLGWTPGVGDGQGGLACCGSWGRKESDTSRHPFRFGPAASVPTSYLSFTKPWMEAWPWAPHPQPQSRMEVMLR